MNVIEIKERLRRFASYKSIFVPEFTWGNLRIDGIKIDLSRRLILGYEIKTKKEDFKQDRKWQEYSIFCSSLTIVCPFDLIHPTEISAPFGLLYVSPLDFRWVKKAKSLQKTQSPSWLFTYIKVLELELPRLEFENKFLLSEIQRLQSFK